MVAGKENVGNLVFCSVAPSVMSWVTPRVKTASGLYYSFGSDLLKKYATNLLRFFTPAARPTGVDDSCEIVSLTYPSRDVTMGTNFRHFRTFSAGLDAIFVLLSLHSFDLL